MKNCGSHLFIHYTQVGDNKCQINGCFNMKQHRRNVVNEGSAQVASPLDRK